VDGLPLSPFPNLHWLTISTGSLLHQIASERNIARLFRSVRGLKILQYDGVIRLDVLAELPAVQYLVIAYQVSGTHRIPYPINLPTSDSLAEARAKYPLKTLIIDLTSMSNHLSIYIGIAIELSHFYVQLFSNLERIVLIYSSKDANSRPRPDFNNRTLQFLLKTPECQEVLKKLPIKLVDSSANL
jgi:hypothetical protein